MTKKHGDGDDIEENEDTKEVALMKKQLQNVCQGHSAT